jgi:hypothetical protein
MNDTVIMVDFKSAHGLCGTAERGTRRTLREQISALSTHSNQRTARKPGIKSIKDRLWYAGKPIILLQSIFKICSLVPIISTSSRRALISVCTVLFSPKILKISL